MKYSKKHEQTTDLFQNNVMQRISQPETEDYMTDV